jgi:hypothetical protein
MSNLETEGIFSLRFFVRPAQDRPKETTLACRVDNIRAQICSNIALYHDVLIRRVDKDADTIKENAAGNK